MSERPFYSDGRYQHIDDQEIRAEQAALKAEYETEQAEIRAELAREFPPRVGPQGELLPDDRRAQQ